MSHEESKIRDLTDEPQEEEQQQVEQQEEQQEEQEEEDQGQQEESAKADSPGSKRARPAEEEEQEEEGEEETAAGQADKQEQSEPDVKKSKTEGGDVDAKEAAAEAAARINASYAAQQSQVVTPTQQEYGAYLAAGVAAAAGGPGAAGAAAGGGGPGAGGEPTGELFIQPGGCPPSRVLHCRNLPEGTTDAELYSMAGPFGQVDKVLALRNKNQAFVQMVHIHSASEMLRYYIQMPPTIRGRPVYMSYSKHVELGSGGSTASSQIPSDPGRINHILMVRIHNVRYPITVDVLKTVFERYGKLVRLVICQQKEPTSSRCLIEYSDSQEATRALVALNGQDIYAGCCTMGIIYSNLPMLTVKYNNHRSRDFTNPHLPPSASAMGGGGGMSPYGGGAPPQAGYGGHPGADPYHAQMAAAAYYAQQQQHGHRPH